MLKEKIIQIKHNDFIIGAISVIAVLAVYFGVFANRGVFITEGWFQVMINEINAGKIPYRDFNMFLTPFVYLYYDVFLHIFGNTYLVLRIFGMFERLFLAYFLYSILSRFYKKYIASIATIVGMVFFANSAVDINYSLYQTCLFASILSAYCVIKYMESNKTVKWHWFILSGLFGGISFLSKQSTGLIVPFAIFVFIILYLSLNNYKLLWNAILYVVGFIIPISLIILWLAINGALSQFFQQVFQAGANSKGISIGSFIVNATKALTAEKQIVPMFIVFGVVFILYFIQKIKIEASNIIIKIILYINFIFLLVYLITDSICIYLNYKPYFGIKILFMVSAIIIVILGMIYNEKIKVINKKIEELFKETSVNKYISIILGSLLLIAFFLSVKLSVILWQEFNKFNVGTIRLSIEYLSFYYVTGAMVYYTIKLITKKDKRGDIRINGLLLMCMLSCAAMLATMLSCLVFEEQASFPTFSFALCAFFSIPTLFDNFKKGVLIILSIIFFSFCVARHIENPYSWWGWNEPSLREDVYSLDLNELQGMKVSLYTKNLYEKITNDINYYTTKDENLLCFPHIPIFNNITGRQTNTFALVHYFDVCSDEVAIKDAETLKKDKPEMIIYMNFPEDAIRAHEVAFRSGNRIGQRDIIDLINSYKNNEYEVVDSFVNDNLHYPIYVLVRKDIYQQKK